MHSIAIYFALLCAGGNSGEAEPFEEDERTIFVDYMMDTFRRDRRVRKQLLLSSDSDEIYHVLADGVILWYGLLLLDYTLPLHWSHA
jgi:hypothetical protein